MSDPETPPHHTGPHHPLRDTHKAFEANELSVRAENCRRVIKTGILFIPLGMITDLWLFPDNLLLFGTVRLVATILFGFLLVPLQTPGPRSVIALSHCAALIPTVMVLWMVAYSGDPMCSYREGLSLIMVVAAMILRWRFIDSFLHGLLTLTAYTLIFMSLGGTLGEYLNAIYFIVATAGFSAFSCYLSTNFRHREYYLREEVEANRQALTDNNEKLQSLAESKARFYANVSHELRTPLTLILGPIEQLSLIPGLRELPRARSHIETLAENGSRLLRLINDLLEVGRLETGDLPERIENIDLNQFSQSIRRSLASVATGKGIKFSVTTHLSGDPVKAIDYDRLEKIVTNLLINALKFTPENGKVSLNLEEADDELILKVSDNGIGLSPEELPHIFDRFWRADSSATRKKQGAGIGLALAKTLAESMDGELSATSTKGKGTTFTLTLPNTPAQSNLSTYNPVLDEPEPRDDTFGRLHQRALEQDILWSEKRSQKPPEQPATASSKNFLVLIVDDEPSMLAHLTTCLEQHRTLTSTSGEQGIRLAIEHQPDLIILDYMMPGMDGIEATRRLRENERTARIPILLITAHGGDAPRISALQADVNDFLTKPFYTSELNARVRNLLLQQKFQSDLQVTNEDLRDTLNELQEKEEELIRSEKLSSLGQMSAGIVHEINNPLNYAKTSLHLLKTFRDQLDADEQEDFDETLEDLDDALRRVIRIVTDLRALTRGNEVMKFPTSLHGIVLNAKRLLSHELEPVTFANTVPEDLEVLANENQLCQVFVNLFQNAVHATSDITEPRISITARRLPDASALITVTDNGHGIPEDIRNKIFDPFFTTKDIGLGTGLGLSLTLKIIEDHQGTIKVESTPDQGTTFRIQLPTSQSKS